MRGPEIPWEVLVLPFLTWARSGDAELSILFHAAWKMLRRCIFLRAPNSKETRGVPFRMCQKPPLAGVHLGPCAMCQVLQWYSTSHVLPRMSWCHVVFLKPASRAGTPAFTQQKLLLYHALIVPACLSYFRSEGRAKWAGDYGKELALWLLLKEKAKVCVLQKVYQDAAEFRSVYEKPCKNLMCMSC